MQKLLIGFLTLAIVGVVGFGVWDASQLPPAEATNMPSDDNAIADTNTTTAEVTQTTTDITQDMPEATQDVVTTNIMPETTREPVVQAQNTMGEAWFAVGNVVLLEDFGFTLQTADGNYFVELGPPTYWQAQGINLVEGMAVSVDGYYNGEQVHARVVNVNGADLVIRTEAGQPMWAGGADHATGADGEQVAGQGGNTFQVEADAWVTLTGTLSTVSNGNVTMTVDDGTVLNLQMGQPTFWQSQGVTLNVGDAVEVLGFWSGEQFMAGDIRKTTTGETIMLRDPNGRQLWAGAGRNGNAGGQGNSTHDTGATGATGTQGNQYRGGANDSATPANNS